MEDQLWCCMELLKKINNLISSSVSISDEKDLVITIATFIVKN